MPDYILNGQAYGGVATALLDAKLDQNVMRPFLGDDGRSWITVPKTDRFGRQVFNKDTNKPMFESKPAMVHNATLTRDSWILIDKTVVASARPRLRAVADVRGAGLVMNIPGGMGKTVLEYQTMGDMTDAVISMDGLRESENDRVEFDTRFLPLPIIHKDFHLTLRQIEASRNGTPLDLTQAEICGRKVAEEAEKLLIGVSSSYSYGGGTVYGYTNHPQRNTKVLTAPTTANHGTTLAEIIDMRQKLMDDGFFGPYVMYVSPNWAAWLDEDFLTAKGDNTFRERILKLEGITDIRTLDYLTGTTAILVQMTGDVVKEIVGMDIVTIQWETNGGMRVNFKVMAIMVPQLRYDPDGGMGIVHGSV